MDGGVKHRREMGTPDGEGNVRLSRYQLDVQEKRQKSTCFSSTASIAHACLGMREKCSHYTKAQNRTQQSDFYSTVRGQTAGERARNISSDGGTSQTQHPDSR